MEGSISNAGLALSKFVHLTSTAPMRPENGTQDRSAFDLLLDIVLAVT
jgi:hypothetical protein